MHTPATVADVVYWGALVLVPLARCRAIRRPVIHVLTKSLRGLVRDHTWIPGALHLEAR